MAITVRNYDVNGPRIEIHKPVAIRPNVVGHTSTMYGSAFVVYRERKDTGASVIGNVHFFDPEIRDDRAVPKILRYFHVRDLTSSTIENVTINGTIRGVGITSPSRMVEFDASGTVEDKGGLLR